ncbi:MAG: polyamine ABC transporter substrate-binding protein [Anaeromyxobacter sp.]|nr:polyamine ABC transporter substrate-binding protein [Anaeromyxobacter sp.]MBL0276856.1 polyamine ABC transporter substrate-binding protein [Anaeromyxobacter sp.]
MPTLPLRRALSTLLRSTLAAALLLGGAAGAAEEKKVLNVYNWADYIGEDTLAGFEKETGIKVRYDNFDSNEILHAKLVAGKSGYDVVVPSSYWAKAQAAAGLLKPLDKSLLPNLKNLDPDLQEALAKLDTGNQYVVPWLWGYTTIGINVGKVKQALGDLPMPANAWDLLFKPEYVSRLKRCGVSVVDAPTEVIPPAMHYLGKPAYSRNLADYAGVPALLASIRPHITLFSSAGYIDDLANGSLCLVMGYSGDINIAKRRAIEGKTGQEIQALIPSTGGIIFVDAMAIPADAPHPRNAHRFIDYILRPEVHAGLTNKVFYANPNRASLPFVTPEVAADKTVFPSPEDMKRMAMPDVLGNDIRRHMTRLYTKFKTGR